MGTDDPAKRLLPHEALLAVEIDPETGATVDLYVERGGKEFTGLAVQAIRVPGLRSLAQLAGAEIIDPPPAVVGIGSLGGPLASCGGGGGAPRGLSELRKVAAGPSPEGGASAAASGEEQDEDAAVDEAAEAASPDDDLELGDIATYRARRAAEGKSEAADADPELDEGALEEAEQDAAAERVLIFPGQAYEVESVRLRVIAVRGRDVEIDVAGRCAAVDEQGEVAAETTPFGGKLHAVLEEA